MRYAVIDRHRGEYPVRLMCRMLEVRPSGYYAWRKASPSVRRLVDELLMRQVAIIHRESDRTYGAPRVLRELRAQDVHVGQKRVARLLRVQGLRARPPKRSVRTTQSGHAEPIAPNRLDRRFALAQVPDINRVWVSDITYVRTQEQHFLYLATVLDLGSRRCVGWSMGDSLDATLAIDALQMALERRRPPPGLLHHSDRGVQYASAAYQKLLTDHGIIASMSRTGDCWDNAVAESFFATLKVELIRKYRWRTRDEARRAIFRYIETWYNPKRRHSTLDYLSPMQYEKQLQQNRAA